MTSHRSPTRKSSDLSSTEGYLLMSILNASADQVYQGEDVPLAKGELLVECVPLPIPAAIGRQTANPFTPSPSDPSTPTQDFWLVLRIGSSFEIPLVPGTELAPTTVGGKIAYLVPSSHIPDAFIRISLPRPSSSDEMENLQALEEMLQQYKSLSPNATALNGVSPPPFAKTSQPVQNGEELRGKVVLINEETGEVVGELDQNIDFEEEKGVAADDKDRPVVLDFGDVATFDHTVKVRRVDQEDMDDWLLKGAHYVSKGILSFGSFTSKMMANGANMYIRNTKPVEEPVKFSPATKQNITRAHNASVSTVRVTKKTVGKINQVIMKVVDHTFDNHIVPAVETFDQMNRNEKFASGKPPIPPRPGASAASAGPPLPPKPAGLSVATDNPPRPPRTTSPNSYTEKAESTGIPIPSKTDSLLAQEQAPPAYTERPQGYPSSQAGPSTSPSTPSSATKAKRPWLNRIVMAGEVVLTSLEATTNDLIVSGTEAASSAAGHKYGPEAGKAASLLGGSVRNVAVVYIDARGVGRRALLKSTAKGFVKAKMKNGEQVQLQGESVHSQPVDVNAGEVELAKSGEIVVGMPEAGRRTPVPSDGRPPPPVSAQRPPPPTADQRPRPPQNTAAPPTQQRSTPPPPWSSSNITKTH